jgi:hypothetical protein
MKINHVVRKQSKKGDYGVQVGAYADLNTLTNLQMSDKSTHPKLNYLV